MEETASSTSPRHPIAVVADRTRLSADVLRVWERRYGVVSPQRGAGGQRLYSDADVEKLRLLHQATAAGRSIGQIASLSVDALREMVREDNEARELSARDSAAAAAPDGGWASYVAPALAAAVALDPAALDAHLRKSARMLGVPQFIEEVVAPFCRTIGDEWHAGRLSTAQEHLATSVVKRVVSSEVASLPIPEGAPSLVIATPAGERHEIGAMLAAAAATVEGWRVIYLGADLPAADIANAVIGTRARVVALSLVYTADSDAVLQELSVLRSALPSGTMLIVGGAAAIGIAPEIERAGAMVVRDHASLAQLLASAARRDGN